MGISPTLRQDKTNQHMLLGGVLMPDILFTCAGTTDPVRGGHDGGILHIMRHYRPEKVYLFLSKEMVELGKKGS